MHYVSMLPTYRFIDRLLRTDTTPRPGDTVEIWDEDTGQDSRGVVLSGESELRVLFPDGSEAQVSRYDCYVADRPSISELWEHALQRDVPDGVAWVDGIEDAVRQQLARGVEALMAGPADYHPGSGTVVRDLVHPSLYPHIAAEAPEGPEQDRWGRPFESSRHQWLPTPFAVDAYGYARIQGEINNLPRAANGALYSALEELFMEMLPLFESVYGYAEDTRFFVPDDDHEGNLPTQAREEAPRPRPLHAKTLQVITKIVEYRLKAGETFEGVWHVEGMSHEHIVATGLYVLSRDDAFQGGTLRFKRAYTLEEAGLLFWNIPQDRPASIEELVAEGTIPIGSTETPADRIVVFPNSHIHKLSTMSVAEGAEEATRRIIVFWLVDPAHPIPSTADVPRPQDQMTHAQALEARLALMQERRLHKQSLNTRAVSLCEH